MKSLKKLVIVDDDDVFVFLMTKAVEINHLFDTVKVFDNGLDALNFLKENASNPEELPEMILLDISMPIMDGWQFMEEYKKLPPIIGEKVMLYVCSTSITPEDGIKAKSISAISDYLIKPVSKEKLIEIIGDLLGKI